jgi:hypothetical protein
VTDFGCPELAELTGKRQLLNKRWDGDEPLVILCQKNHTCAVKAGKVVTDIDQRQHENNQEQ